MTTLSTAGAIGWERTARWRRILLFFLIVVTTLIAAGFMAHILPYGGANALEVVLVIFFGLLFAWISIGFWTAMLGGVLLWREFDRFTISRTAADVEEHAPKKRTAILMPIYNENVAGVFAGIRAIYQSLSRSRNLEDFDFFVLSDSTDPDSWVGEEIAWIGLCHELKGFGRLFYRHRRSNIKRKSGNIADFCRRWGKNYEYMVVLDADSIMTGETIVTMVRLMERNPRVGILQTVPLVVGHQSLIARAQQFASHVYGPMFAAGLHFWQLGDAQYWGHNAIIRIDPFMKHCGLPRLPGKPPLGGEILSHDFVEAALMREAGWEVWLAYDLSGSWEEAPSTLGEELTRDRRWCQGNIQHLRLLLARRILPIHRVLFLNGAMSYVSALLWFLFLTISSVKAVIQAVYGPEYFPEPEQLFPQWPIWNLGWALTLLTSTFIILLLPKIFSFILIAWKQKRAGNFGGTLKLLSSIGAEVFLSMLLAPLRMLAHSRFVFGTLLRKSIQWIPPSRQESGTGWSDAFRLHGGGMVLALVWGVTLFILNRAFFWWLLPVLLPLLLGVPISVWTSRVSLGRRLFQWGLFLIPEEVRTPNELQIVDNGETGPGCVEALRGEYDDGFMSAVVDPVVHALHLQLRHKHGPVRSEISANRRRLIEKALLGGPEDLTRREKNDLLGSSDCLTELHRLVWELPSGEAARRWGIFAAGPRGSGGER